MTIGDYIAKYRKTNKISQRAFAKRCGLSNGYISMLERGCNPKTKEPICPTLPQLKKLADGMSVSVTEIFETVDDMPVDISIVQDYASTSNCESPILSENEREMLRLFSQLSSNDQIVEINRIRTLYNL